MSAPMMRPVWAVAAFLGRPEETIRTWVKSGRLPSTRDAKTGRLLVDLHAARELAATRQRRRRTSRSAG